MSFKKRPDNRVIFFAKQRTGAVNEPSTVNELLKQYNMMKPMLTGLAGSDKKDQAAMIQDMQAKLMDPSSNPKSFGKKQRSKTVSASDKKKAAKDRKKRLAQLKKEKKKKKFGK